MTADRRAAWFVFVAAVVFFSIGAASRGLWHPDEHRIAEIARVMSLPGGDWIVPHLGGEVYTHKPPVVPWIVAIAHGPLGLDLAIAAKVPSILGGALAVLATFLIARRFFGHTAGVAAATVLATAGEFDWICRRAQYDPLLTGFTTMGMWCFVRSRFPAPDERATPWRDAILGSLCVGLGVMVKGPVALIFTAPVLIAFAVASRESKSLATPRAAAVLLVLLPAAVWLTFAGAQGGTDYASKLVIDRAAAQTGGDDSKAEPFWYYLVALPKGLLPWTFFLPAAVLAATSRRKDDERRADLFTLAWLVVPFVVMSLIPAKRDLYLLPLYPALAICVGKLAALGDERLRGAAFGVPRTIVGVLALAGGVLAIVLAALVMTGQDGAIESRVPAWTTVRGGIGWSGPILTVLAGALLAVLGWKTLRDASPARAFEHVLSGAVVGSMAFAAIVLPSADPAESPRRFYEKTAALVGDAPVVRYGVNDFAGHWTMRRAQIPYVREADAAERFLRDTPGPAFVVVERETLDRKGAPARTRIVLEERLPLDKDLLLLTRDDR